MRTGFDGNVCAKTATGLTIAHSRMTAKVVREACKYSAARQASDEFMIILPKSC